MSLAWHFLDEKGLLRNGDAPPENGVPLIHEGALELCVSGLHASEKARDALMFAPGPIICRVECSGDILRESDKLVCCERTILWRADATDTLRAFARWCALEVASLWDMPQVVREYLETGDEPKRAAAMDAAWDAARAAAWAAAWDAARAAARDAARYAEREWQARRLLQYLDGEV